jgi:hypothetical protein
MTADPFEEKTGSGDVHSTAGEHSAATLESETSPTETRTATIDKKRIHYSFLLSFILKIGDNITTF